MLILLGFPPLVPIHSSLRKSTAMPRHGDVVATEPTTWQVHRQAILSHTLPFSSLVSCL